MYNGRRRHIRTESIQDQDLQNKSLPMYREMGRVLSNMSGPEFSGDKNKKQKLAEREMYKEQNSFLSSQKTKNK